MLIRVSGLVRDLALKNKGMILEAGEGARTPAGLKSGSNPFTSHFFTILVAREVRKGQCLSVGIMVIIVLRDYGCVAV